MEVSLPSEPPPNRRSVGEMLALPPVSWVRVEGENFAISDLATLQRWVLEKRVLREDSCSHDGAHWSPLGGRPELQLFFAASDRLEKSSASAQHALLTMAHSASDDVFADAPHPGEEVGWLTDARTELLPAAAPSVAQIAIGGDSETLEAGEADEDDEAGSPSVQQLSFGMHPVEQLPDIDYGDGDPNSNPELLGRSPSGTAGVRVGLPSKGDDSGRSNGAGAQVSARFGVQADPPSAARPVPPPAMVPLADEIASRPGPTLRAADAPGRPSLGKAALPPDAGLSASRGPVSAPVETSPPPPASAGNPVGLAEARRASARPAEELRPDAPARSAAEAARPRPVAVRAGTPLVTGAIGAERTITAGRNQTDPTPPRVGAGLPPKLHPNANLDEEGTSLGTWVAVGIVAVTAALLALWLSGSLGPPVAKRPVAEGARKLRTETVPEAAAAPAVTPATPPLAAAVPAVDTDSTTADVVPPAPKETTDVPVKRAGDTMATPEAVRPAPLHPGMAPATAAPVTTVPTATPRATPAAPAAGSTTKAKAAPAAVPAAAAVPAKVTGRAAAKAGWDAVENEDYKAAYAAFGATLGVEPTNVWALYGRAYSSERMGDTSGALRDYCAAITRTKSADLLRDLRAGVQRLGGTCE